MRGSRWSARVSLAIGYLTIVAGCVLLLGASASAAPSWWTTRSVIDTNQPVADYAPLNLGQLKWIATNACDELETSIPGGAGADLWAFVRGFSNTNNYLTANLGQLKYAGKLVYDRLIYVYYCSNYPWTAATTDDTDFAIANIGQAKELFDFEVATDQDADGLKDWWEVHFFGSITNGVAGADPDSDDLVNTAEYWYATCPTNSDSDYDSFSDSVEIAAGTDPRDASSCPAADVSGTAAYSGGQTGIIRVLAATSSNAWTATHYVALASPGAYSLTNLPTIDIYWFRAFRDRNGDGTNNAGEPWGEYTNNPAYLTNDLAGVNITLTDPDGDSDGLLDWYETGTSNFVSATDTGSDPTKADTDSDGINDGTEVTNRTDPNDNDTAAPTVTIEPLGNAETLLLVP